MGVLLLRPGCLACAAGHLALSWADSGGFHRAISTHQSPYFAPGCRFYLGLSSKMLCETNFIVHHVHERVLNKIS